MRLKRLEVRGFKSFADRTEFAFDADLTGIVGPNGCGKSNVVDAFKWVLGDQRVRSLRGSEMTDVIFKGAEGRDSQFAAEVSVVLEGDETDGDDGPLGGRSEVSIGRRLTRERESSYLIDGEVVRLKDVRELLMDTGLGVGAYSVMEQGRIDAVLSANPEDRRGIFEEAAGISKFKIQKRETLRKLERTEHNLDRVKDLVEERARRIRSLKIQAGRARRYGEISSRLRDLKSALAVVEARAVRRNESELASRRDELESRLADAEREFDGAHAEALELDSRISACEAEARRAHDRVRDAESRRDAEQGRAGSLEHRAEELRGDAVACGQRVEALTEQTLARRTALEDARARLVELEERLIELGRQLEDRREAAGLAQAAVKAVQAEREVARDSLLDCIHERTRVRNRAHDAEAELRGLAVREDRLTARAAELAAESAQRAQEVDEWAERLGEFEERGRYLADEGARVLGELEGADREASELARLESGLRERLASTTSRLEVLQAMEAHLEGLDQGPRALLDAQPRGLRGRLVDQLEVDLEYSKALEAVLGPYVQALVVDTRADASRMLDELAQHHGGRALLVIAEEFERELREPSAEALPPGAEYLVRKVRCKEAAWPLVHWLLRGVCIVDSIEEADPLRHDLCFVTRTGALSCGPRFEGGEGDEAHAGLVVRRAQIQSLGDDVGELAGQIGELKGDIESVAGRVMAFKEQIRGIDIARQGVREREQDARTELHRLRGRLGDLERERETIALERREIHRHHVEMIAALGSYLLEELLVKRRERRATEAERDVDARLERVRAEAEAAVSGEQDVRVEQAGCSSDREALKNELRLQEQALRELERAAGDLEERRATALKGAEKAAADAVACRERVSHGEAELERQRAAAGTADERLAAERRRKAEIQDVVRQLESKRAEVRDEHNQCRLDLVECDHRFVRLEERLRAETSIELRRCLSEIDGLGLEVLEIFGPPAEPGSVEQLLGPAIPEALLLPHRSLGRSWDDPEFDPPAAARETKVLQSQIDRLGSVNLDAVNELAEEESRFATLEQDVVDLTQARKSLMEALRQMETESRAMFEQTFERARENFQTIFRKLFQGGRADMFLAESEDSLEAGIDIVAKPPGKELQSIALLSGGERALTALAILFAVFKVKPSPFCILDEVDAALDETNVERFLRVLRDFVGPSQFCVVTHHKRTMAACEVLYGVTMQKRGVSTRIGVSLEEADGFADAGGDGRAERKRIAGEEKVGF